MSAAFRIIQLSDLHLGATPEPHQGIDVRGQFLQTLDKLAGEDFDLLVLSGDLAAEVGEIEIYLWLKHVLEEFARPYVLMAGNHDDVTNLRRVFALGEAREQPDKLYFRRDLRDMPLFFLDTSDYTLPRAQTDWLKAQLAALTPLAGQRVRPALLFMHHPPAHCGCGFMDSRYPLRNIEESWPALRDIPNITHIFCGHYHTAKTFSIDGKFIHLCPSTMMQIDPRSAGFAIQHTHPGWRVIDWDGEELLTTVHHLR